MEPGSVCSLRKGRRPPEGGERRGDSSQRRLQGRHPFQEAKLAEAYLTFKEMCVHLSGRECIYRVPFPLQTQDALTLIIRLDFCSSRH